MDMKLDHKNFGRLNEGIIIVIGIGTGISIAGLVAFGVLLALGSPWFSVPLIFVFLGIWIAARQWGELGTFRIVAGFVASIKEPTDITMASNMLGMRKQTFVHSLSKLITRGVVKAVFFPEFDAFGPKGSKLKSVPKEYQTTPAAPVMTAQRFATILTWIGLIGTIVSLIYHILGLMNYMGMLG